jgi:hypothetical protein
VECESQLLQGFTEEQKLEERTCKFSFAVMASIDKDRAAGKMNLSL